VVSLLSLKNSETSCWMGEEAVGGGISTSTSFSIRLPSWPRTLSASEGALEASGDANGRRAPCLLFFRGAGLTPTVSLAIVLALGAHRVRPGLVAATVALLCVDERRRGRVLAQGFFHPLLKGPRRPAESRRGGRPRR